MSNRAILHMEVLQPKVFTNVDLEIKEKYNINKNTPQQNQEILNNSYDILISELVKIKSNQKKLLPIIDNLEQEKSINIDLFTNSSKLKTLKLNNNRMSFLYKCTTSKKNNKLIFTEFVESLLCGYKYYVKSNLQDLKKELIVLKKYNTLNENRFNIEEVKNQIQFLDTHKTSLKYLPYKILADNLNLTKQELQVYHKYIKDNTTLKTMEKHFNNLDKNFIKNIY